MAIFRIQKNKNYTVMSNYHLRDRELSLKAKGLLSFILSLPEDWSFSVRGLAELSNDGVDSVRSAINELEKHRYLKRYRARDEDGKLGESVYDVFENPEGLSEKPTTENPTQVNSTQGNATQINTKEINTKKINTKDNDTPLPPLSEKLRQALNDFYEMRKKIRKPMTSRAKQLALNKLRSLSSDEDTQVKIIEQSILNGWQSFYELKGDNDGRYKGNRSKVTSDPRFRTIAECERVFGVGEGTAEEDVPFT